MFAFLSCPLLTLLTVSAFTNPHIVYSLWGSQDGGPVREKGTKSEGVLQDRKDLLERGSSKTEGSYYSEGHIRSRGLVKERV